MAPKKEEVFQVDCNLEKWLASQDVSHFPNGNNYIDIYNHLKKSLEPIHQEVEKGALLNDIKRYIQDSEEQLESVMPVSYLNNHGIQHVQKVIEKASEILTQFECKITPYEAFILLCAIHFHDVGNILGREFHEKKCRTIMEEIVKPKLDIIEKYTIIILAYSHGGSVDNKPNDKDKIHLLKERNTVKGKSVRKRFLAAVLRFADELADDSSRSNDAIIQLDETLGDLLGASEIFHIYSESLHSVTIEEIGKMNVIKLDYFFDSKHVFKKLKKGNKTCYLLDEIYARTLKMFKELKYCMRYMAPQVFLDKIVVDIAIHKEKSIETHNIRYILEDKGYPNLDKLKIKSFSPELKTGVQLKKEWKEGAI